MRACRSDLPQRANPGMRGAERIHESSRRLLLVLGLCGAATSVLAAQPYTFTPLLSPTGSSAIAHDINNSGQVVGGGSVGGENHAVLWNHGVATDLGTLGGNYGVALAINDRGQVVGGSEPDLHHGGHAVLWDSQGIHDLGTVGDLTYAYAINNAGTIVGSGHCACGNGDVVPLLFGSTGFTLLDTSPLPNGEARAINDAGQIAGYRAWPEKGQYEPVIWQGDRVVALGQPYPGATSIPEAINDAEEVVGSTGSHAVKWLGGSPAVLDDTSSTTFAYDVNGAGEIVGTRWNGRDHTARHAVAWDAEGARLDLNTLLSPADIAAGWVLQDAFGINDAGVIAGDATNTRTGSSVGFTLAPSSVPAVPEPATLTLIGIGLGPVAIAARRRRSRAEAASA